MRNSSDTDARAAGSASVSSSDIELIAEGNKLTQTFGLRLNGSDIPQVAAIVNAGIKLHVNDTDAVAPSPLPHGKATDHAMAFAGSALDVSSKQPTPTTVMWTPAAWDAVSNVGAQQRRFRQ